MLPDLPAEVDGIAITGLSPGHGPVTVLVFDGAPNNPIHTGTGIDVDLVSALEGALKSRQVNTQLEGIVEVEPHAEP